jgi:hypothetical protein
VAAPGLAGDLPRPGAVALPPGPPPAPVAFGVLTPSGPAWLTAEEYGRILEQAEAVAEHNRWASMAREKARKKKGLTPTKGATK